MALLTPLQVALILIAMATYTLYIKWVRSKYPPGPWPLPIIGNLHLLSKKPYIQLTKMFKTYGPIFTVWMGWQPTVVVSGLHLMNEIADQKGYDFAGRSLDTLCFRIISHDNEDFLCRTYDEKTRTLRKLALSIVKSKTIGGFSIQKVVEEEVQQFLKILKNVNEKLVDPSIFINLPIFNVTMRTVLNIRFENQDDPDFLTWKKALEDLWSAIETATMIGLAPAIAYVIPGLQNRIRSQIQPFYDLTNEKVERHEKTYQEGVIRDLTDLMIEYQRHQGEVVSLSQKITRLNVCQSVKDMLSAGTQTVQNVIRWVFLVLLYRKDIQQKVHSELDQYLERRGKDCLKNRRSDAQNENSNFSQLHFTLSDKPYLPYLNAFILETMRLWTVGPLGLPHKTMVDTSLGNHSIPKDTTVVFNVYGCHRDETIWKKPLECTPERFLDTKGELDNAKVKQLVSFGIAPRNCTGENLARIELFICLANVLHTFELCCPSVDELPPLTDGHFRLDLGTYPFKMFFKMRKKY